MKWPTAQLGAVTKIVSGSTPKSGNPAFWSGDILWATPTDLSGLATKELATTGRMITKAGLASCSAAMLPARSVLFSSRAPIGLVAINKDPLCTNQGFKSFVPEKSRLSPDFLYWWLKCHRAALEHLGRGATFKEVSKSIIEAVEIPLPPLAEQKRIAGILDAADALRAKRREALAQLEALLQSSFLTLFGDPMSNPMGWENDSLGNHGSFKNGLNYGNSEKGFDVRCLGVGDFKAHSKIENVDALPLLKLDSRPSEGYFLKDADLVFVRSNGNKALVGRCLSIFPGKTPTTFSGFCIRYRIESGDLNPAYLTHLFRSKSFRVKLLQSGQGANIQNINQQILCALPIPLPPLPLQQKFATIVESIERQKTTQRAHLAELDALFAALQHRAFRGEL
jgi:type I restriction enzyme S subunit